MWRSVVTLVILRLAMHLRLEAPSPLARVGRTSEPRRVAQEPLCPRHQLHLGARALDARALASRETKVAVSSACDHPGGGAGGDADHGARGGGGAPAAARAEEPAQGRARQPA